MGLRRQQQQQCAGQRMEGGDECVILCMCVCASFIVMKFQEIKLMNNKKFWWRRWEWKEGIGGDRALLLRLSIFVLSAYCKMMLMILLMAIGNYFIVIRRHRRHVIKFSVNLNASNVWCIHPFTFYILHPHPHPHPQL